MQYWILKSYFISDLSTNAATLFEVPLVTQAVYLKNDLTKIKEDVYSSSRFSNSTFEFTEKTSAISDKESVQVNLVKEEEEAEVQWRGSWVMQSFFASLA